MTWAALWSASLLVLTSLPGLFCVLVANGNLLAYCFKDRWTRNARTAYGVLIWVVVSVGASAALVAVLPLPAMLRAPSAFGAVVWLWFEDPLWKRWAGIDGGGAGLSGDDAECLGTTAFGRKVAKACIMAVLVNTVVVAWLGAHPWADLDPKHLLMKPLVSGGPAGAAGAAGSE